MNANAIKVREAIERAILNWTGADWRHEWVIDGERQYDLYDEPEERLIAYCQGDRENCSTCARAKETAKDAQEEGALAIACLPDLERALTHVRIACLIERDWGDDPTWGDVCSLIERLMEEEE